MTAEFKERLLARLRELGQSQQWLEEQLGVGKGTMHKFLNTQHSSLWVDPICEVLKIDPPYDGDPEIAEIIADIRRVPPGQREPLKALIRALTQKP